MAHGDLALSSGLSLAKEYALPKKLQQPNTGQKSEENGVARSDRESGVSWSESDSADGSELNLSEHESNYLLASATTARPVRPARSTAFSSQMSERLMQTFAAAYANSFSYNLLLGKVSEWLVGNVMEHLVCLGMSSDELAEYKARIRADLIGQNETALAQVYYDQTVHSIVAS